MWPFGKLQAKSKNVQAGVHDPVLKALAPWIQRHERAAWRPVVSDAPTAAALSHFGGRPHLRPGEPPPCCAVCQQPIDLFLQLDGRETPDGSGWHGPFVLQFFYCRRCEVEHEGWGAFSKAHVVRRVPAAELTAPGPAAPPSAPGPDGLAPLEPRTIVGWTALDDAPQPAEQDELGLEITYDFKAKRAAVSCPSIGVHIEDLDMMATDDKGQELAEALGTAADGDKLGGWPHWIQGLEYPACPQCSAVMTYLFQIDSEDNVDHMFGDSGCGHIFQCAEHPDVLAFGWACC